MKFVVVKSFFEVHHRYEFSKFHDTEQDAKEEAERLCRKERAAFMVFELKGTCYIGEIPVAWK